MSTVPYNQLSHAIAAHGHTYASRIYWDEIRQARWMAQYHRWPRAYTARVIRAYRAAWQTLCSSSPHPWGCTGPSQSQLETMTKKAYR